MMLLISKASSKLISGEGNFERPIHLKIGSPIRHSSQLAVSLLSSLTLDLWLIPDTHPVELHQS